MDFSDEYDKILEERPDYGFEFEYRSGHLDGNPMLLSKQDMIDIGIVRGNDQNLFIYCRKCGTYMDFQQGKNNMLDGKYICPVCRKSVRERTPYSRLNEANEAFLAELEDDDYEDYYGDEDDEDDSGEYYEEVCGELGDYTPWLDD